MFYWENSRTFDWAMFNMALLVTTRGWDTCFHKKSTGLSALTTSMKDLQSREHLKRRILARSCCDCQHHSYIVLVHLSDENRLYMTILCKSSGLTFCLFQISLAFLKVYTSLLLRTPPLCFSPSGEHLFPNAAAEAELRPMLLRGLSRSMGERSAIHWYPRG